MYGVITGMALSLGVFAVLTLTIAFTIYKISSLQEESLPPRPEPEKSLYDPAMLGLAAQLEVDMYAPNESIKPSFFSEPVEQCDCNDCTEFLALSAEIPEKKTKKKTKKAKKKPIKKPKKKK